MQLWSQRQIWQQNLVVVTLGSITTVVAMTAFLPFLPTFVAELGAPPQDVAQLSGIAYSSAFIVFAFTAPLWGKMGDKYGRKAMLLRASLLSGVVVIGLGFVHTVTQLILVRLLLGLTGGYYSSAVVAMAATIPENKMTQSLGILASGAMMGNVLGPLVGGFLPTYFGPRWTFGIIGVSIILTFVMTWKFFIPDESGLDSPEVKKNIPEEMKPAKQILSPRIISLLILTVFITFSIYTAEPVLTLLVQQISPDNMKPQANAISGIAFSLTAIGVVLSSPLLGKVADKIGNVTVISFSLLTVGILLLLQSLSTDVYAFIALRFLQGLALGGLSGTVISELRHRIKGNPGFVLGLNGTASFMGQVIGPTAGGLVEKLTSVSHVYTMTGIVALIGLVFTVVIVR